jgi:predicted nucleic-acid-binding protein
VIRYRLDTNVLVRFLTHDDLTQAAKVNALFQEASDGGCLLILSKIVLVETVWVLRSVYNTPHERIAESLGKLVIKPGILCEEGQMTLDALNRYKQTNLDIVDCFLAAQSAAEGEVVAAFDTGFGMFSDVQIWDHEAAKGM